MAVSKTHLTSEELAKLPPVVKLAISHIEPVNGTKEDTEAYIKNIISNLSKCDVFDVVVPLSQNNELLGFAFAWVKKGDVNSVLATCKRVTCGSMHKHDKTGRPVFLDEAGKLPAPAQILINVADRQEVYVP